MMDRAEKREERMERISTRLGTGITEAHDVENLIKSWLLLLPMKFRGILVGATYLVEKRPEIPKGYVVKKFQVVDEKLFIKTYEESERMRLFSFKEPKCTLTEAIDSWYEDGLLFSYKEAYDYFNEGLLDETMSTITTISTGNARMLVSVPSIVIETLEETK